MKDQTLKENNIKLGFITAFARASILALKEIPAANVSIEVTRSSYRDYVDLGVAVATPEALVTPVLRNAEAMGFLDIEKGIAELGKIACDGKLTIEDMAGGSFTISSSLFSMMFCNLTRLLYFAKSWRGPLCTTQSSGPHTTKTGSGAS